MYFEDVSDDLSITTPPVVMKKENMLNFSNELDPLKIHNDPEYAKNTRFGDIIAPGVLTFMSIWAKFVETGFLAKS